MTKTFCDCCGIEKGQDGGKTFTSFSYLCHLEKIAKGSLSYHIDSDSAPISGRHETYEVCMTCYNSIMIEAVRNFLTLSEK